MLVSRHVFRQYAACNLNLFLLFFPSSINLTIAQLPISHLLTAAVQESRHRYNNETSLRTLLLVAEKTTTKNTACLLLL